MSEKKTDHKCYCGTDLYASSGTWTTTQVSTGKESKPKRYWITYCKNKNCPNNYWKNKTFPEIIRMLKNKTVDLRK